MLKHHDSFKLHIVMFFIVNYFNLTTNLEHLYGL